MERIERQLPSEDELDELYRKWFHRVYGVELHKTFNNRMAVKFARHAMAQWSGIKNPGWTKP